jgi:ribose transport system ATP-binding protein
LVRRLRGQGLAIIYISHFLEEISAVCDRYTVLRDGRSVGGGAVAGAQHDRIVSLMVGRDVEALYPRNHHQPGEPVLTIENLAGRARPASATFELRRGEVLGIAGLIGAGRTELLRAIFGLDPVRRGDIRVAAVSGPAAPGARWRQGVGFVSENRKAEGLATGLSIADNLTLPRLGGLGPAWLVSPSRQASAARRWVERLSIRCASPAQRVSALSGGNQQKVALARLLHADVDVLLLDEPTRGIDVGSKAEIYRLIDELARGGRAVLMVSSYLPELLGVCDRIAVMHRGRLGPARPAADWNEQTLMLAATGAAGGE